MPECPVCQAGQPADPDGFMRSHAGPTGLFCPGSGSPTRARAETLTRYEGARVWKRHEAGPGVINKKTHAAKPRYRGRKVGGWTGREPRSWR